jgi:hypothetical protein
MDVRIQLSGTKQELDRFCDAMGWRRQERSDSRGWSWTTVTLPAGHKATYVARECTLTVPAQEVDMTMYAAVRLHGGVGA